MKMLIPKYKYISRKRLEQLKRGHGTEEYQTWRNKVLLRDNYQCQFTDKGHKCCSKDSLEVHHIKRFNDANHLRTETFNGITLCAKHHRMIYAKENFYELLFLGIVAENEKHAKNTNPNPSGHS